MRHNEDLYVDFVGGGSILFAVFGFVCAVALVRAGIVPADWFVPLLMAIVLLPGLLLAAFAWALGTLMDLLGRRKS